MPAASGTLSAPLTVTLTPAVPAETTTVSDVTPQRIAIQVNGAKVTASVNGLQAQINIDGVSSQAQALIDAVTAALVNQAKAGSLAVVQRPGLAGRAGRAGQISGPAGREARIAARQGLRAAFGAKAGAGAAKPQ